MLERIRFKRVRFWLILDSPYKYQLLVCSARPVNAVISELVVERELPRHSVYVVHPRIGCAVCSSRVSTATWRRSSGRRRRSRSPSTTTGGRQVCAARDDSLAFALLPLPLALPLPLPLPLQITRFSSKTAHECSRRMRTSHLLDTSTVVEGLARGEARERREGTRGHWRDDERERRAR